ncbi:unnamed protein product [Ectocarpus sp. CCAP 1310/34]|nr:unnamed protein product [Ectocarpus sp. CCAP 1310/34]
MAARDESVFLQHSLPVVEHALGYRFGDRRLLLTALTHRSFCNETHTASGDFDELEWLGDSVLQLAVSSWLFRSAKGSRRSSGQLSATRQRFVDSHACESFARQLNLLPYLRIGHGQPVGGTKILADCFEAVLGAVYVDAGGCSDLEPIHAILARVIPSYKHDRRLQVPRQPPHPRHPHSHPHGAMEPPPGPPAEGPRKLMNLAHRLTQIAKRDADRVEGGGGRAAQPMQGDAPASPPLSRAANGSDRDPLEVVREFDGRLRDFQGNVLRGGALSFSSRAFAGAFGEDEARFFSAVATGCPERCALLDSVLDGSSMLRKHFDGAPPGAERVVMEVVLVPSELRLQTFTVVEFLLNNVLQPQGGSGEPADNPVLRLIRSAPHGDATIAFLSSIVTETATNLLLNAHQRATISAGVALAPLPAPLYGPPVPNGVYMSPPPPGSPMSPLSPPHLPGPGGGRGPPPHLGLPSLQNHFSLPRRKRSHPHRGGGPWGSAGPRGRGGGLGRRGGRGGRGGGGITRGKC